MFLTILELPRPFRIPLGLTISNRLIAIATTAIAIATATTTTTAFEIDRKTVD